MSILVITTGGTIGAAPYADPGMPPRYSAMSPDGHSLVSKALETEFPEYRARCVPLAPRDSKHIDGEYREKLLKIVKEAPENKILVTHGTDAMLKTADFFYRQFLDNAALAGKTIVITGAMTPLSNGPESDGLLNLEFSLKALADDAMPPSTISMVLCDFDHDGAWKPRLYSYKPDHYEKFHAPDGRYSRIRELSRPEES